MVQGGPRRLELEPGDLDRELGGALFGCGPARQQLGGVELLLGDAAGLAEFAPPLELVLRAARLRGSRGRVLLGGLQGVLGGGHPRLGLGAGAGVRTKPGTGADTSKRSRTRVRPSSSTTTASGPRVTTPISTATGRGRKPQTRAATARAARRASPMERRVGMAGYSRVLSTATRSSRPSRYQMRANDSAAAVSAAAPARARLNGSTTSGIR